MIFQTIAFIFARGDSKGLKDKNILQIGDKPLIAHSIDLAKKIKEIDIIFVSTDSDKIASIGISCNSEGTFSSSWQSKAKARRNAEVSSRNRS